MKSVELYFMPSSFYSQKARLSLEEKRIKYKETIVWLLENEQQQPWYLKLNPNGEVPTLRVGDEYHTESENIIDIVDGLPSDIQSNLVPSSDSAEGQGVTYWRKRIDEVQVPILTFGVAVFPELAPGKAAGMIPNAQAVRNRFEGSKMNLEKMKMKHPHMTDDYDRKIAQVDKRLKDFFDKGKILEILEDVDTRIAEVEQQLLKVSKTGGDYFLCGKTFTAADINLCVLLGRFRMVGLLPRFVDAQIYPSLDNYWQRVQNRPSVQKVVINNVAEMKSIVIGRKIRRYAGVGVAVGIVGVAVWLARSYFKK